MQISDRITGLAVAVLGGSAILGASYLPPMPGQQIGPSVFPTVVGAALVACGLAISIRRPDDGEDDGRDRSWMRSPLAYVRLALPPALLIAYVMIVETVGFLLTAAGLVFITALAMGARLKLAAPLALVAPVVAYLIFGKLLRVSLPPGLVPFPW
jgi:putative tricarboxylic transport membrane protein